jgi:GNAT superfamily N-acetyltransferase
VWHVESVHLLERLRPADGPPRWVAVAEEPLGGPRIVGRGGVELALRVGATIEPAVAVLADIDPHAVVAGKGTQVLVAVAEQPGSPGVPVGVALGRVGATGAVLDHLAVPNEHRRQGIARQVLGAWCDRALRMGAPTVRMRSRRRSASACSTPPPGAVGSGRWAN